MKNRNIEKSDNWETPEELYQELNNEFEFDFDPCPICFEESIPPEKDGLLIEWGKSNFVNPPYSQKLKMEFVKRGIEESKKGKLCVFLLPVSTSTILFQDYILPNITEPIRFLRGRVKFKGYNTKGEYVENRCGMHDSMIVIFNGRSKENK